MRQLVIACQKKDEIAVHEVVRDFAHPTVLRFVSVVPVDVNAENLSAEKLKVIDACRACITGATTTDSLVCATKEVGQALKLGTALRPFNLEYQEHTLDKLCKAQPGNAKPILNRLLSGCGLAIRSAVAESLASWSHGDIDAHAIDLWAGQFAQLGAPSKLSQSILASIRFIGQAELINLLCPNQPPSGYAVCVNHDNRTHGKSADVIANLLTKRLGGVQVYQGPAEAIDKGFKSLIVYEDGLFTGTEAVGVLESLLGEREAARRKTAPLADPSVFSTVKIILSYGLATDYGVGLVQQFLNERKFTNVSIDCAETFLVTPPSLLSQIHAGAWTTSELWGTGPPSIGLSPHFLEFARAHGYLSAGELMEANAFCTHLGRQLFYNYTQEMKRRKSDYRDWAESKLDKCAWGMWGQGLSVAFGHSVPKASLPLLWGTGPVKYKDKKLDNWRPLLPHAW